jgi:predicted DNA-binding WGR domain protein
MVLCSKPVGLRHFTRIRPKQNERRWYAIMWGPMLFGTWGVTLSWGRLGSSWHRRRILEFPTAEEAITEAEAQIERRLKRGYEALTLIQS